MRAFDGDPAIKASLLGQLDAAIAEGRFAPDDLKVLDGVSSAVALLAGEADARRYEAATGTPGALGLLLDRLVWMQFGDRAAVRQLARDWLSFVEPGTDLSALPGQLALQFLTDETVVVASARDSAVQAAVQELAELHRSVIAGETVTRKQWSAARAAALEATDNAIDEPARHAGVLAEALAWDPRTSRTILIDALRPVAELRAANAVRASGWSTDDAHNADTLMQALWDETTPAREADPVGYAFPPIFAARHPEVSRGFGAALALSNDTFQRTAAQISEQVLALLTKATASADRQTV